MSHGCRLIWDLPSEWPDLKHSLCTYFGLNAASHSMTVRIPKSQKRKLRLREVNLQGPQKE